MLQDRATHHVQAGQSILLVDDDELFIKLMTYKLESAGYRVTGETDSLAALERFRENPARFQVVLTDRCMPHLSGSELAQRLLQLDPQALIIGLSGTLDHAQRRLASASGIRILLSKDAALESLVRRPEWLTRLNGQAQPVRLRP